MMKLLLRELLTHLQFYEVVSKLFHKLGALSVQGRSLPKVGHLDIPHVNVVSDSIHLQFGFLGKKDTIRLNLKPFMAPTGAQEMQMIIRLSDEKCSGAHDLHLFGLD